MLKFNSLHLKKCVYFKDAKLPLNTGDILVVNGKNLKSREKHQTNGSGKSLFFSYIPNIVFASHPLAIKANSKKEMYTAGTSGKATFVFENGYTKYQITQNGGSNSVGYDIKKDGKDQKIRTTPLSEKYIKSVFPLTEAEFYTTVYLNSQRDFVFQRGKSDARLKFFTEFFRLDYYDQMKSTFQEELRKVKRVEIEVSTYEGQRLRLVEDIKEIEQDTNSNSLGELDALKEKLEKLKSTRKKLSNTIDKLSKEKSYLELQSQLLASIGEAKRPTKDEKAKLEKKIEKLEHQIEILNTIKSSSTSLNRTTTKAKDSKAKLKALCTSIDVTLGEVKEFDPNSKIVEKYNKLLARLEELKSNKKTKEALTKKLSVVESEIKILLSAKNLKLKITESEQQVTTYKKLKAHIEDETCPICGSVVDLDTLKEKAKKATVTLENLAIQSKYYKIKSDIDSIEFEESDYIKVKNDVSKLQDDFNKHSKLAKNYKEVLNLISDYQSARQEEKILVGQLDKLEAKIDKNLDTSKIDTYRNIFATQINSSKLYTQLDNLLKKCKEAEVSIENLSLTEVKLKLKESIDRHSKIEGSVDEISSIVNRGTVQTEKLKLLDRKLKEVNSKIEELNSIVSDKELLENLIKVYSNKGIKIQRVNAICRILERNLNHFKSLLFDENFKFKIIIEENTFDVIVDRNDGIVSDVRHLSGSEGRRFNLLLLISLLPLTPANRRSNLVILDEMESNASPTSIGLFCDRFIPELHKLVPNIIVVSPLDLHIENSKKVLVTKDKDGSRIEFINQISG